MDSPLLTDREKGAVLWAEHVTQNSARHRSDIQECLKGLFSDQELFELTFIISYFNFRNRLHDSLLLPLDEEEKVGENTGFLQPDPQKMKAYLQAVVDNWPDEFPVPNQA